MTGRAVFVVTVLATCVAGCGSAGRAGGPAPDGGSRGFQAALAGRWSRDRQVDAAIGPPATDALLEVLEFAVDSEPGSLDEELRGELRRLGHRVVATARFFPRESADRWVITHRDGETFGCVVVPNVGLLAHRLSLLRGDTADRDVLIVQWDFPGMGRYVSAYRRAH